MLRVALLDEYQRVALQSADWPSLAADVAVEAFHDHLTDEVDLAARLQPFDVVMALRERTPFPRSLLERLPNLKLIATAGMRNASIDLATATELGILVCGTTGSSRATMELTWGLILALLRHIPREDRAVRDGRWQETVGIGLEGKALGIVGLGNIGRAVARRARAFDMRVLYTRRRPDDSQLGERRELDDLLRHADVVSLHVPLSDETDGLLDRRRLGLLRDGACVVNTARGRVVDEGALVDELASGRLRAGLDVFAHEPDVPAALFGLPNVVLAPHIGSATGNTRAAMTRVVVDNVHAAAAGRPLATPV